MIRSIVEENAPYLDNRLDVASFKSRKQFLNTIKEQEKRIESSDEFYNNVDLTPFVNLA